MAMEMERRRVARGKKRETRARVPRYECVFVLSIGKLNGNSGGEGEGEEAG